VAKDKPKGKGKEADPAPEDESAEAIEGEGGEEGGKKKLPLRLIIIGAAAAVLVLGGGGTAAFLLLAPKPDAAHAHKTDKPKKDDKKDAKDDKTAPQIKDGPDGVVYFTMPDVVVNMQTADGKPTFLKLKLTFEVPDHATADAMTPETPRMKDMFQTFLRELRPEDLQGSQGSFQLRMEILRRVNLVIAPAKVNAVLIEEMLIN
jgi:flagellar FliL protein